MFDIAGQERTKEGKSARADWGVKGCVESARLLMCPSKCISVAVVQYDGAVTDRGMKILICIEV